MPLLALFLTAGLFGPPALGVSADSTSYNMVQIGWLKPPPETVCKGDTVQVMFIWMVMHYTQEPGGAITAVPSDDPLTTILFANTMSTGVGTVSPRKWEFRTFSSVGRYSATYKATKTGGDEITISGTGVDPAGATTEYFEVVNCNYDLTIAASAFVDDPTTKIDTELYGKATIQIDNNGVLSGEGPYHYTVSITYIPPKTITCDPIAKSTSDSSFTVSGTASIRNIIFDIKFLPLEIKSVVAKCKDKEGKDIEKDVFPGGPVDVQKELNLPTWGLPANTVQDSDSFPFRNGWGMWWLVKRKPK